MPRTFAEQRYYGLNYMQHELVELQNASEIVNFKKFYAIIWRMKWFIIIVTSLFAGATVIYAVNQPNVYTAKGIFVPAESQASGGLSQLAGQFGGLASMAGINIGGGQGDDNAIAIELLKSRSFLQRFVEKRQILPQLLAAVDWDPATNKLIYDEEIYDPRANKWVRNPPPGKQVVPTAWEAYEIMRSLVKSEYQKKKGVIFMSVTYLSPEISAQWLKWLVEDLNEYWREKDKQQAESSIRYLQEQVSLTNNTEMTTIFYSIIAEQTKMMLLAEVRKEYLFTTLAPVVVPEEKSAPSRALLCVVGTFVGGLFSLLLSLIYVAARPARNGKMA